VNYLEEKKRDENTDKVDVKERVLKVRRRGGFCKH
jgi:hypothetical protein